MSVNKNPFEIRTDLLAMAKDYMDRQQTIADEFAKHAYKTAIESGKANAEMWEKFKPTMYSVEDLKKVAEQMYTFVAPVTSGPQTLNEGKRK